MIAKLICSNQVDDGKSMEIVFNINPIDEWKFMVWVDMMNAYDDMRKSTANFNQLRREIIDDYDKDFKEEECDW